MKTLTKLTDKKLLALKGDNELKDAVIDTIINRTPSERIHFITCTLQNGCVSGMVGELIYYSDTCKFYEKHKDDIYLLAEEQAQEMGYNNVFELYASLNGAKDLGGIDQQENLLAWYGFEETLRNIANELEIEY